MKENGRRKEDINFEHTYIALCCDKVGNIDLESKQYFKGEIIVSLNFYECGSVPSTKRSLNNYFDFHKYRL